MLSLMRIFLILLLTAVPALAQPLRTVVGQDELYTVRAGDTLYSVARAHRLALEHLAFANGLPVSLEPVRSRRLIIPGRRLLPAEPPDDGLVLNLPERGIFLFLGGKYRSFYPVAIGGLGWETPVGEFHIATRTVDPTWFPPAWAGIPWPVPPGPDNPLGDRWLGLSYGGYGIHATNAPSSIGGAVSHGCIRTYPELARELFDQVQVGTPIRIEYEPVKVGWDSEAGEVVMTVFPDVYGRVDLMAEARRRLEPGPVDEARWMAVVARAAGRVETIAGGRLRVVVNGRELPAPVVGMVRQDKLYVAAGLLEELELSLEVSGENVRISWRDLQLEVKPLKLGPELLLPVGQILPPFGWDSRWEGNARVLRLSRGDSPSAPVPAPVPLYPER